MKSVSESLNQLVQKCWFIWNEISEWVIESIIHWRMLIRPGKSTTTTVSKKFSKTSEHDPEDCHWSCSSESWLLLHTPSRSVNFLHRRRVKSVENMKREHKDNEEKSDPRAENDDWLLTHIRVFLRNKLQHTWSRFRKQRCHMGNIISPNQSYYLNQQPLNRCARHRQHSLKHYNTALKKLSNVFLNF